MNPLSHRLSIISKTVVLVLLCCFLVTHAVYAQDIITSTTSSDVQTATIAPEDQTSSVSNLAQNPAPTSQEDTIFGAINPTTWDWWLRILSALLLSVIGGWAIYSVFRYVTGIQNRYYDVAADLARRGQTTRTEIVSSGLPVSAMAPSAASMALQGSDTPAPIPKVLSIKGPNTVAVNVESAEFKALVVQNDKDISAGETVAWKVVPETAAVLSRPTGLTVRITPKQLGAFDLVAKVDDATSGTRFTETHFPVAAIASAGNATSLPFVGEGWGTIVLAILFGVIIALLGLSRVLSTALVGTLLGALLGYIFGIGNSGSGSGSSRPANPVAPSPTVGNPSADGNG